MNIEITYCLLADIKERRSNISSLIDIFQELVESLLANHYRENNSGLLSDLRNKFFEVYGLSIPYPTLKIILSKIKSSYPENIQIYKDFSFICTKGNFIDLTNNIIEESKCIEELNEIYKKYCSDKNAEINENIFEFIDKSKKDLIAFANGKENNDFISKNQHVYDFIYIVKNIEKYKKIFKKLILGSIISSYFEIDHSGQTNHKTLLFDTNFIISLMDLHSIESFVTCDTIIDIAKKLNFDLLVLPETIKEIKNLLYKKSEKIDDITLFISSHEHTIEAGCARKQLTSSDLKLYSSKVEYFVENKGIKIIYKEAYESLENEAKKSDIFKKMAERPFNKEGALHDAVAMVFIKKLRNGKSTDFSNINSFFVTDTTGYLEKKSSYSTAMPYIIRSEELLNILWLSNPCFDTQIVNSNLARLLSLHLEKKLPNKEMLGRIDDKISKYAKLGLNEKDCVDLATSISEVDTKQLEQLLAADEEDIFKQKLAECAGIARERRRIKDESSTEEFNRIINFIEEMHEIEKKDAIIAIQIELESKHKKFDSTAKSIQHKLLEDIISRDNDEVYQITTSISLLEIKQTKRIRLVLSSIFAVNIFAIIIFLLAICKDWSKNEPITYALLFAPFIFSSLFYIITGKSFNFDLAKKNISYLLNKRTISEINCLETRKEIIEKRISDTKKEISNILV